MVDKKTTDLDSLTAVAIDDLVRVVDVSDSTSAVTGTSKKVFPRLFGAVTTDVTIQIGPGETYETINSAIDVYGNLIPIDGAVVTLELQTGFVMAEQVIVSSGMDLSHIKITSIDAQVSVTRTAIDTFTNTLDGFQGIGTWGGLFMAGGGSTLPRIGTIFSFDSSGTADYRRNGIFITNGSKCIVEDGCGIHDTDGNGIHARYGSTAIIGGSTWDNNGRDEAATVNELCGIRSEFQAIVIAPEVTVTNSNQHGIQILGASVATLRDATVSGCADVGIYGGGSSVIHARGVDVQTCVTGMYAYEGCIVRLIQSNLSNNTGNGLWIASSSIVNAATGCTIDDNGANGVRITSGGRFSIVTPTITGNTNDGIDCANGDVFISAGEISGNTENDLSISGANACIRISGVLTTTSGNTAANNVTDSNVTAFNVPQRSGVGGIYGRGGYVSNRGTATIASGNTSVAVTHGVDFTPLLQEVSVTPTNDMSSASKFWISNMTSTQFTINVDTDPGAGGATFGWNVHRIVG